MGIFFLLFFFLEPGCYIIIKLSLELVPNLFRDRTLVLCISTEQLIQHPAAQQCGIQFVQYSTGIMQVCLNNFF
jgi:hypothetical protein